MDGVTPALGEGGGCLGTLRFREPSLILEGRWNTPSSFRDKTVPGRDCSGARGYGAGRAVKLRGAHCVTPVGRGRDCVSFAAAKQITTESVLLAKGLEGSFEPAQSSENKPHSWLF